MVYAPWALFPVHDFGIWALTSLGHKRIFFPLLPRRHPFPSIPPFCIMSETLTTLRSFARYPDVSHQNLTAGDLNSFGVEGGERSPGAETDQLNQGSESSVANTTPSSTFSPPGQDARVFSQSSPASSVCGQECVGEDSSTEPQHPPETGTATTGQYPGQPPRTPSILSRFFSPRRQAGPNHSRLAEATSASKGTLEGSVTLPIPSEGKMYRFIRAPGLYIGMEDQVRPSLRQEEKWESEIKPRFWTDVLEFQRKIRKSKMGNRYPPAISPELRMSGYAESPTSTHVTLLPRIWVLYDHDRWRKEIKKFVDELEWLRQEGFGPVEIRKGCPALATLRPPLVIEGLPMSPGRGFQLPGGAYLYLHVEARQKPSAIGLLCCATVTREGSVCAQRFSKIGGMLAIDRQRQLAITTAHGMVELLWNEILELQEKPESEAGTDEDDDSRESSPSDDYYYESDDSSGFPPAAWDETSWPIIASSLNPQEVHEWEPVEILGVTSFLGTEILDPEQASFDIFGGRSQVEEELESTDFSLWGVSRAGRLKNEYLTKNGHLHRVSSIAGSPCSDIPDWSATQERDLLLGPDETLKVQLLQGTSQFMVRGVRFTCQKIRTDAPLGMLQCCPDS